MEKNINTLTENKPSEKPETYYNSGKWQDGIAKALLDLEEAFKSKKISYEERQKRKTAYKAAMDSCN